VTLQSAVSTPHTNNSSPAVHSDDRRPLAICVRNLPARSSDTSLKDGLFHEYKKHGKVTWVKVVGQGSDRYAVVCFKKPEDVDKALQVSHDKLFFGCKIEVAPYQGYDVDDNEFRFVARPYEAEQDEFHPKATRTLFIGNLEKDITAPELRKHFDQFGEIIEIDIKKQASNSSYAFCQYCDIGSVVRAMRTLDGEHLGNNRIKLGFGKSLHTNCVWVDGVAESVTEKYLSLQFSQFGPVSHVAIDRSRGHALVFYDQIAFAQSAVKEMRGVVVRGRKLQVDFASRECQEAFYDHLEKQTGHNTTFESVQVSPQGMTGNVTRGFETPSSSSSSSGGGTSRYPRFSSQPTITRSYSRGTVSPGASPSTPARSTPRHITTSSRFDFNAEYLPERRPYRSYEEMSMEDGGGIVTVTVGQGPQDIRHLQKERVALLEQLEDCASSGEEGSSRRRCKHRRSHSGEGSRPGTPLCDERPENLPPLEPRRTPRERPPDPLSLPLPRFATQLMSPRPAPPSPPASPPRPQSTSSDDSEPSPPEPEWEERLKSLDEKYEKWSGSRTVMAKVDTSALRVRHKLLNLDLNELQPSEIVKSVLAKRSVFDEDSKRLENFGEKYEPREFVPTRPGFTPLRPRLDSPLLHSPATPKSPVASSSPAGAKGLQYPFPSHPPVQPTTSVATTTAAISIASCSTISSGVASSSVDTSRSPQTFPTSSTTTVPAVRQFQAPSSTFPPLPKMSPPPSLDKKVEHVDPRLCIDKTKSHNKILPPNTSTSELLRNEPIVAPLMKPLKSCLRRESGDDRRDNDGRRRSHDEDLKAVNILKTDCDKERDSEVIERRRSFSDPRRRDSMDSNKESLRCESVSEKIKDRNHKEERRRRDSVDNSVKRDSEIGDNKSSRLSDSRINEHSNSADCSQFTDTLNLNISIDTRHDDNLRHTQPTDTSEKKKDSLQVCPERDRRRGRDSIENNSDSSRLRKVPESLDIKRELESDTRQKDCTDKNDPSCKKSLEYIERRKDSGHSENSKNNEIFDRRKDGSISHEISRHRERKEHSTRKEKDHLEMFENSRHRSSCRQSSEEFDILRSKDERRLSHTETSKPREHSLRRDSESSEELSHKNYDKKESEVNMSNKHQDMLQKKEQNCIELLNSSIKTEDFNEMPQYKDTKRDNDSSTNNKYKENNRHNDYIRPKENHKKKECAESLHIQYSGELKKDDKPVVIKQEIDEQDKESEFIRHSKQLNFEYFTHRLKDHDKRKDSDKHEPKQKNAERMLHNDSFENPKQRNYSKIDRDATNQISEWVEEIRKDLENSGYAKTRETINEIGSLDVKPRDLLHPCENYQQSGEMRKEEFEMKIKEEIKQEEESEYKENEKKKVEASDYRYYDKKNNCDPAEIFRRKEIVRKKEADINNYKSKEFERIRENDCIENSRNRIGGEKKKDGHDRDHHKEKESTDYFSENNKQDWMEAKHVDKKIDHEEMRKSKETESSEKYYSESDSIDVRKNESENPKVYDVNHHNEEGVSKNDFIRKEKKKERLNSWPAAIGCKRRMSSQDSLEISIDETKKSKPERRDSKDSGRSSGSSKKGANEKHKSYTKLLEEKIREDKEKEMNKKRKDDEVQSENLKLGIKKDKKNVEKRKDDRKGRLRHKENGITASESEAGSCDEGSKTPKRHSIFDIVDEEPAYISMYDKVKARSTKNMQKQEEEKRQERLKEKFNQLKQSRAKREEKKRSTSYDEDSDSERGGRRSNKLMITSSEDDNGSESDIRTKGRKIMSDTSEDDNHRHPNITCIKPIRINSEESEPKPRKILSDNSEDDSLRLNIARLKAARTHQEGLEPKLRKILSDTSEDDAMKHTIIRSKPSRIQSDESENELGYEDKKQDDFYNKKPNDYATSDLFSNISEDPEHPSQTDIEKECNRNVTDSNTSDIHRKKSHKKKQKRQKAIEDAEDGSSSKRHNSKKDRRKSSHSHDGDDDQTGLTKVRKKKSERDNSKRDEKIEDIFGPLSDDSDKVHNKWNVSQIYGSDSEEERQIVRKREKRRKERKARELDEAGRALEAKLLEKSENVSEDFTRTKKKKRKKSRDEKGSKHHQQRLGEEEAAALANEADSEREVEPPILPPSLPRLMDSPPPSVNQNKKPDIPGFGSQVDENIHETAVKSISESPTKPVEEKREPIEDPTTTSSTEEKPTPVISQEETEDAVAALLLEDSFGGGFETYTKPDTPVSEPDLQIDTDTEDTFDPIDFSRPPRTPDIPTSFYRQQDTREGLEERILALACPDNSANKQESENSCHAKSPSSTNVTDYNERETKVKQDEKDKPELDKPFPSSGQHLVPNKDKGEVKDTSKNKNSSKFETEMENKPDSSSLGFQADVSLLSKPLFSDVKSQSSAEQSVQKISGTKVTIGTEKLSLAPQAPQISTSTPLATQAPSASQVALPSPVPTISLPSPQVSLPSQVPSPVSLPSQISTQATLSSQVPSPVSLPSQVTQVTLSSQVSSPVSLPSQVQAKSMPSSIPPPLIHTTNQLSRNTSGNLLSPVSVSLASQGECTKTIQASPSQMSHSTIFSPQEEIHKSKVLHSQAVMQSNPEKTLITKPVSQIIVTPSTTVALIVQTQSKVIQSNQQSSSVLQLSNKLHSPGNHPMEIKNSGQLPQYVLHHTLQPSHLLTSQQNSNKMSQQIGQPNQGATGQVHQGSHKLAVPAIPTSAKSPALPGSAKSPVLTAASKLPDQVAVQQQQYKQIVLNHHPHNQQLSINVSHSHQLSGNVLLSPSQQMMYSSHSPASSHHPSTALSFSSHHVKVPVSQQQVNNLHPSVLQHSPNMHHQQISPLAQKQMQHSPAIQQNATQHVSPNQLQNKSSPTLLQQVPNCVTSLPVQLCSPTKPGTLQTIRHLSPVSQPSSTNKINAHVLQPTGVQQVRAVLLQNPVKQTVTLLQPPMVQKSLGTQLIRPVNVPQPQVVHTLKNDPPVLERNRLPPPEIQLSQTVKADLVFPPSKVLAKPTEEPLPLIGSKKDDAQKVNDCDGFDFKENNKQIPLNNKSVVLENKPTNIVENVSSETKQTSLNKQVEHTKSVTSKPLDQVVHELHEKKQSIDPKETIKLEERVDNVKKEIDSKDDTVEIKKENKEAETKQEVKPENTTQLDCKTEVEEVGKMQSAKGLEEGIEHDKLESDAVLCNNAKSLESLNGINKFDKNINKPLEEPKVEKIRIKKEENGLCIDPTPSSCTKNQTTIDQTDIKTEIKVEDLKSDEILDKQDADEEARESKEQQQVTTRGGRGGRRRKAAGRAGGVVTRRARLNNTATSSSDIASADVYEFRDDSEEEANRPRLILTIKSPPDPIPPSVASQPNSSSTRKSRRLQEKDGNRNTVDDTIEDVIRGTRSGSRRTTRAVANCAPIPVQTLETRKSPRRKQSAVAPPVPVIAEVKPTAVEEQPPPQQTPPQPPPLPPPLPPPSAEPMTLIDPVTGLLIPMRESEEGQYIPVNSDHIRSLESKEDSGEPVEKRMRTTLPTEQETSLPTRPGIPVKVPPNCAVVPPLPPKTTPKSITSLDMARPILSHSKPPVATKTTGIVVPSGIPRPTTTLPNPVTLNKPLTIAATSLVKPPGVMMSPTGINKASVTNVVGPMTINRVVAPPPVSPSSKPVMPLSASISHNHKSHLLQAVRGKMPVAKVPTPMTPKAHILHSMSNVGREGLVGTPPPPHHGTLLTGSVASPPLRAPSQQPVVTGASSARVVCKGMLDPLKVDSGGCIVVPTASPLPHTQVMQAGLPVPAYEASMGEVVQHVNFPPHHIQPAHYVHPQLAYQQYLRDAALTGYHLPQGVKSEEEARVSPPLELRRGSPHDRTTDSPQVATVYMHGNRHLYYEPPPAHRPSQPRLQVSTPPHASQVPPQADSLLMLLQRYPVMWQGLLALKTDQAAVQMHFVFGNPHVARDSLPCNSDGSTPPLRIAQRMRLEQTQVEGVARKMQMDNEHCMLLALPCGRDHMDVLQQSNNLQSGFITYLQQKQAAGIVNIAGPGSQQAAYVVHIFPSCEFANESLARIAPDLLHRVANIAHLLIVIATV